MPVINARDLTRAYGSFTVLAGASVAIHRGERVGVVGINGSGKSTLGRILAGADEPDSGEVSRRRGANIAYLAQRPDLPPGVSACDVALSGLDAWCAARRAYDAASAELAAGHLSGAQLAARIKTQSAAAEDLERHGGWDLVHRAEAILGHLGIADPSADVGPMSGGEQRRVALARVLVSQPDLAILDEPTNHLDLDAVEWLERHLIEDYSGALLLITHDRYILDRVATRTLEVSRGRVFSYDGGYETYLLARAERGAHEERAESNRQNLLRTELEWLRRQPKARATKSQSRVDRVEALAAIEKPRTDAQVSLTATDQRSGKTILELHDLTVRIGDRLLVAPLTLHLGQGERVGIVGPNGCGKTTLLRCLIGELEPASGHVVRGANARIAYLDQTAGDLDDDATVFDAIIGDRGSVRIGDYEISPRAYVERFLFDNTAQRSRVGTLSGGERARVALARLLADPANLLVLDEPTNDLDVGTLGALETMLIEFGGTALVVTHDRYFLDRVATSILAFEGDGKVVRHHGSYSDYLEQRRQKAAAAAAASKARPAEKRGAARSSTASLSYAEEKERLALPDRIEAGEQRVAGVEEALADPDLYATRGAEVAGLLAKLAQAKGEVEALMQRWEELETKSGESR